MDVPESQNTGVRLRPRKVKRKRTKTKVLEAAVSRHFAAQFAEQVADLAAQLDEARAEAGATATQALREVDERLRPAVVEAENALRRLYRKLGLPQGQVRLYVSATISGAAAPVGLSCFGPARSLIVEQSAAVRDIQRRLRLVLAERDLQELEVLEEMDKAKTTEAKRRILGARGIADRQGAA
ncbi:MAG: hypothetical protein NUW23_02455 [Firmicutes bacterium]|jgi:hypothetical protein|nr:hypothetical protein [Bacillota bacterium]